MATRTVNKRSILLIPLVALLVGALLRPATAHVGKDFNHLWSDHIKPKLATPGELNNNENPVAWTKLKGVPGGFADGKDAGVEIAGFGLNLIEDDLYGRRFAVDQEQIQRRVDACSGDSSISAINEDGSVVCNTDDTSGTGSAGPTAFTVLDIDTGIICNSENCAEGKLTLPRSDWLVFAYITMDCEEHCGVQASAISCQLRRESGSEAAAFRSTLMKGVVTMPVSLQAVLANYEGSVSLTCRDFGNSEHFADYSGIRMRLTAIPLPGVTTQSP